MPLQVWVQAVQHGLSIVEVPVPLIYLDESRAFGGSLDDSSIPAEALQAGLQGRPAGRGLKWRGGVGISRAIACGLPQRRRPAGGATPRRGGERLRPTAAGSPAGIMTSRAAGPAGCAALLHREVIVRRMPFLAAMAWTLPRRPVLGRLVITPLVVTGHQPELFHPGVWVKNFAPAALARAHGGLGLNLIVDNDLPKSASIRVPSRRQGPHPAVGVEFDQWQGEMPYEDWRSMTSPFSHRSAIGPGRSLAGW